MSVLVVALGNSHIGDLAIKSDNLEDLKTQLQAWRTSIETRGLRINVGKTKIFGSSDQAQKPTRNAKWSCGVLQRSWCKLNTLPDLQPLNSEKVLRS